MAGGLDRRVLVTGMAALATPGWAQTPRPSYGYAVLDLRLDPGQPLAAALRAQLSGAGVTPPGGRVIGAFIPQLGWKSSQAALLIDEGPGARPGAVRRTLARPGTALETYDRLTPTARPTDGQPPRPGGIYVHRWFVVRTADLAEVVDLSVQGWRDFERRFDTNIFGLFAAGQTPADRRHDQTRLLLITRYRDHGVWEASRDPSTEAMDAFRRRARLTRSSWAASTLLLSPTP